jgi:hypothetical protein
MPKERLLNEFKTIRRNYKMLKNWVSGIGVLSIWLLAIIQGFLYIWWGTSSVDYWGDITITAMYPQFRWSAILTVIIAIPITVIWAVLVDDSHYTDEEDEIVSVVQEKTEAP